MFSSRLRWSQPPNPLWILRNEKRRAGADVLDLTESNPTHAGLIYCDSEILNALSDPQALRYDPSPRGLKTAREALSRYYAARGMEVPPSQILLTTSTSEAYAYLFKLLCDPGDEVLAPRPSYPLFEFLAGLESVTMRQYPLRYDGVWHLDFDALERAVTPHTRAVVAVNPNNPTGSFLKREEASRLEQFAARHELAILSDEVFSDYAFMPDPQRVPTLAGNRTALTFSMSGLSKIAGLPQMKLGWIVCAGARQEEALDKLEWIADTYLSVSTPVQLALPRLLELPVPIHERTTANLAALRGLVQGSAVHVLNVEGGWYATLQVPRTRSEEEWTLGLLREQNILVQPGFFYDFETEAFLVVSLLTPEQTFAEGVRRILAMAG